MATRKLTGPRAIRALDEIHEAMSCPFDWSADTPEAVADVLTRLGYRFPPEGPIVAFENEVGRGYVTPKVRRFIKQFRAPR